MLPFTARVMDPDLMFANVGADVRYIKAKFNMKIINVLGYWNSYIIISVPMKIWY